MSLVVPGTARAESIHCYVMPRDIRHVLLGLPERHTYNSLGDFEKAEDYLRQAGLWSRLLDS